MSWEAQTKEGYEFGGFSVTNGTETAEFSVE